MRLNFMADLNKLMVEVQKEGTDLEKRLKNFLIKYEELYREGNMQLMSERTASAGSMEGLEQFHRLVQIMRRNKDVAGSLVRGISNLRSMSNFKFVEEEVPKPVEKKLKKRLTPKAPLEPRPEPEPESELKPEHIAATEGVDG